MDLDALKEQEYEVIADKTLSNQDHLFKLIIIGDTGMDLSQNYNFCPLYYHRETTQV